MGSSKRKNKNLIETYKT